jgi:hypothetical protein
MSIRNNLLKYFILTAALFYGLSRGINAQEGTWMVHPLEGVGSGANKYSCGDGCIGFTRANSQFILVFDITVGEWLVVDLGTVQSIRNLQTQGNVLIAWSQELIFGYSATTGTWDTVQYEGTILSDNPQKPVGSFGCSDSLAFFVTDQMFYVFDGSLGNWQQYEYTMPPDFSWGNFYIKDDCIILVLRQKDPYASIRNVVYSAHTQSFNELENGCSITKYSYDHGYAGIVNVMGMSDEYILIGYSAFDNQFDVTNYITGDNEYPIECFDAILPADTFSAFSIGFRKLVTPYELVQIKFYGYSTTLGEWNTYNYDVDWTEESYYGNAHFGGQYTVDFATEKDPQIYHFFFYSASDGIFKDANPGLIYTSTTSSFMTGGNVFSAYDALYGWGYNPSKNQGALVDLIYDNNSCYATGADYATLVRWSTTSETMRMFFYNSNTNRWTWIDAPQHADISGITGPHAYVHKAGPENNVILYSSILDTIINKDLPDSIISYAEINGNLIAVRSVNQSILFNAESGTLYEMDFEFNQNGLGKGSAAYVDTSSGLLYGYSSLSEKWITWPITEDNYICLDPGYIGLIPAWMGVQPLNKFYTFNSLADSWIGLEPEGAHVTYQIGNRTALLIRTNHIYAFAPYGSSGAEGVKDRSLISGLMLEQNFPNPFSQSTTIRYRLSRPSDVVLSIYNMLGQELQVLVKEHQPAGSYSVTWDVTDGNYQPPGPGIYIYQLRAGKEVKSRRMILIKPAI